MTDTPIKPVKDYIKSVPCSSCGQDTEWDSSVGPVPLCISCWDKACETFNSYAAYQRRYREAHREERAAYKRKYHQAHREERAAYQRKYYQAHREERAASQRKYYQAHREERAAYQRKYHQAHREEQNEQGDQSN